MVSSRNRDTWQKWTAFVTAVCLILPLMIMTMPSANAQIFGGGQQRRAPQKPGMSTGKKVMLLGGAALLYFLYKKHQAKKASEGQMANNNGRQAAMPQLYRSKNGGIYYRDAQKRPVWLTAPQQSMQVSTQDLQRYAPDYDQYSGPAPAAPRGYRVQRFNEFDPSIFDQSQTPAGRGNGLPPGPRGY